MCCTAINGIKCTNKSNSVGFTILASLPSPPDSSNGCTHAFTLPIATWTRKEAVADERGRERK